MSAGDVVAATGLDVARVQAALYALMRSHRCRLAVREDGSLAYDFGPTLVPVDRTPWKERLAAGGRWLWKAFSWVYKASLAVMLVAYAVAFVVLIIAAAIAAAAATEDDGPATGAFELVGAIFRGIFEFATHTAIVYDHVDRHGYRHHHYEPKAPVLPRKKRDQGAPPPKSFIASVYDFVLGPARVEPHPRAQHREVAAFVRKRGGVLTIRDVQALSGMPREEAEAFFATFVAEQNGVAEITEDGALYATFDELMRSETAHHDAPVVFYWDEYEAPFELTGNRGGRNFVIAALAAFNLAGAYVVTAGGAGDLGGFGFWMGVVPAIIFSLFFLLPLLRAPVVWWRNRRQHTNNVRKRIYREIFASHDHYLSAQTLVERANQRASTEEQLRVADLEDMLAQTVDEVGVGLNLDARGDLAADMRQLLLEQQAAEEQALDERPRARVVHTTD